MALETPNAEAPHHQRLKTVFVYVIAPERGPVKIGISADPARRLIKAQTDNALRLRLAHKIGLSEEVARSVEAHAHWLAREHHIAGEWYSLTADEAFTFVQAAATAAQAGERLRRDRRPVKLLDGNRRVGADGLHRIFMAGEIDAAQFRAGNLYRRAAEAADADLQPHQWRRADAVVDLLLDARKRMATLDARLLEALGPHALHCFKLVVVEGRALGNLVTGRAWARLGQIIRDGLDIVANRAEDARNGA